VHVEKEFSLSWLNFRATSMVNFI